MTGPDSGCSTSGSGPPEVRAALPPVLPVDALLPEVRAALERHRAAVFVAPPGSGKTTRVPPALTGAGPLVLLQPRRLAARSIARRIAWEQGWTLGEEVGWQVRFESRYGPRTRLLVATEGILVERLQSDPLLHDFRTVVLDEFHERSLHADLTLALAREAWRARDDLRLLVMSATLDAEAVAAYLDGCPVLTATGRQHPVEIGYRPEQTLDAAVREALGSGRGHVLCFLPGAPEIRDLSRDLSRSPLAGGPEPVVVLPLHGSLAPEEQDRVLAPLPGQRKVILATNVAETSLTVDGVTTVVDGGWHKVLRHDVATGLDRLSLERIPRAAAEQRAGRAGRTGPGRALRLWDPRLELRPYREPDIARVDLAAPFLDVLAWGGDPRTLEWFEAPPPERAAAAMALLERLGAVHRGRLTAEGARLRTLPLHPRLARLLLASGPAARIAAAACAILAEGWRPRVEQAAGEATRSDLLSAADRIAEAPPAVRQIARELERSATSLRVDSGRAAHRPSPPPPPEGEGRGEGRSPIEAGSSAASSADENFLRAVLAAFPDRVARRRTPDSRKLLLSTGTGAELHRQSGVQSEFLIAVETSQTPGSVEPAVRVASAIEKDWLEPDHRETVHWLDDGGTVRAGERAFYGALLLAERNLPPDPDRAAEILYEALAAKPLDERNAEFLHRLETAGLEVDLPALLRAACAGRSSLPTLDLASLLPPAQARHLDRLAPLDLALPSGRRTRLRYRAAGEIYAAVKLQEVFGLAESPRLGPNRTAVTFELLAPSGRPVQTTRDLRSFWERTYPEVRKELRGRYPRHPWPEDPWTAPATHRVKPRGT